MVRRTIAVTVLSVCCLAPARAALEFTATAQMAGPYEADRFQSGQGGTATVDFRSEHQFDIRGAAANQQFNCDWQTSLGNLDSDGGNFIATCNSMGEFSLPGDALTASRDLVPNSYNIAARTEFHDAADNDPADDDERSVGFWVD
jgi:hypothetical protein